MNSAVLVPAGLAAPLPAWSAGGRDVRPRMPDEVAPVPVAPGKQMAVRDSRARGDASGKNVQAHWNPAKGAEVVTVALGMNRDGTVIAKSLRSIPRDMSDTESFRSARRAILRCGRIGFDLPADQRGAWREIEMTFDPVVEGEQ